MISASAETNAKFGSLRTIQSATILNGRTSINDIHSSTLNRLLWPICYFFLGCINTERETAARIEETKKSVEQEFVAGQKCKC